MSDNIQMAIADAIDSKKIDIVISMFNKFPDQYSAFTPFIGGWLHYAAQAADVFVVKYMVEMGFDVNFKDDLD